MVYWTGERIYYPNAAQPEKLSIPQEEGRSTVEALREICEGTGEEHTKTNPRPQKRGEEAGKHYERAGGS